MDKNKYYRDFTYSEIRVGFNSMLSEVSNQPLWLRTLLFKCWKDFQDLRFSYDGATFVKERYDNTLFEVASFIHDWFNSMGYVGKNVDKLFIDIMEQLRYPKGIIRTRKILMWFTPINIIRHIILGSYKGDIDINKFKNEKIIL